MSTWQAEKAERNQRSLARLRRALPIVFPPAVLARALDRPFIPPTPRLAIESYWRAHPLRAERLARALAARTGPPTGWTWRMSQNPQNRPTSNISRATSSVPRAGIQLRRRLLLCVRSTRLQARLAQGSWDTGPNKNAVWHCACVVAWQFWNAPNGETPVLRRLQGRRCGQTGGRLWKDAEVDHRVPLFRVWRDHRNEGWPNLLSYWGLPNLQLINRKVHVEKCAIEARYRASSDTSCEFVYEKLALSTPIGT
jgi:hypothetical protein